MTSRWGTSKHCSKENILNLARDWTSFNKLSTCLVPDTKKSRPPVMRTTGQPIRALPPSSQSLDSHQEACLIRKHSDSRQSSWWGVWFEYCRIFWLLIVIFFTYYLSFSLPLSLSHTHTRSCLSSCRRALTTLCSVWPLSTREPVAVRAPSTSGTGTTR